MNSVDQTMTLYAKVGGEPAIAKVVDYFYELILADNKVNEFLKTRIWRNNVSIKPNLSPSH